MASNIGIAVWIGVTAIVNVVDTMPADRRTAPADAVQSNPVSLGDGDYVLVARKGQELSLQHTRSGQIAAWKVLPKEVHPDATASDDRWQPDGIGARITEIALARWSRSSLLAVVKVSRDQNAAFWCLSFPHVVRLTEGTEELSPNAVVLVKGGPEDRVLALSGSLNSPAITLVTAKLSKSEPNKIEVGAITYEWCGAPECARIGRFQPEYTADNKASKCFELYQKIIEP